jgi:Family of unknown function (DUF6186)
MTARDVIIAGFAVLLGLILAAVVLTHVRRDQVATISATLDSLIASRPVRIIAVLIWAWLGWHFLAR